MPKINISSETTRLNRELIALVREKPILYSNLTKRSTNRTDAWNYISKVLINNSFKKMDGKHNYLNIFIKIYFSFYII